MEILTQSPDDARPSSPREMESALESALRRHVLDVWFPRCVDLEHGGFLCDFDRAWRFSGPHDKLLEFQARQTTLAANASAFYPHDESLRSAAEHGFRFLRDALWDADSGGWFHRLDRAGAPQASQTKHSHGAAYAIQACVAVHSATADPEALDLALQGFRWLENHARDREYGGYSGFLERDGTVITVPAEGPSASIEDPIGTPVGLKDVNVNSDLLEAFTRLYRATQDATVGKRVLEVAEHVSDQVTATGALHHFYQPDWRPEPHLVRFGYQMQLAFRLLYARDLIGGSVDGVGCAVRLVDCVLAHGWDERSGGIYYAAPATPPFWLEGSDLVVRAKSWWVQFDALKALIHLSRAVPDGAKYLRGCVALWQFVERDLLDQRYGGVYAAARGRRGLRDVLAGRSAIVHRTRKGNVWKDGSHDGLALIECLKVLRADEAGFDNCAERARKNGL